MEFLKEIMGDSYKENLTKEEVTDFFKKQVLSSGQYELKEKSNAEKIKLQNQINDYKKQIADKMTDDEKQKAETEDTKKLIEQYKQQLFESRSLLSKKSASSILAEARIKAGIDDNDDDFSNFINEISFEDIDKTDKISNYVSKIVQNAYESGKNDAIKNKLAKMGNFKNDNNDNLNNEEKGSFGKQLAQSTSNVNQNQKDFFAKK